MKRAQKTSCNEIPNVVFAHLNVIGRERVVFCFSVRRLVQQPAQRFRDSSFDSLHGVALARPRLPVHEQGANPTEPVRAVVWSRHRADQRRRATAKHLQVLHAIVEGLLGREPARFVVHALWREGGREGGRERLGQTGEYVRRR